MTFKIFGLVITTKSAIKVLEKQAVSLGDQVVAALGKNNTLVEAADAAIASLKASQGKGMSGIQKLEAAGKAIVPVLLSELIEGDLVPDISYAATQAEHIAIAFVQSRFIEIEREAQSFVMKIAKALGLIK